MCQYYLVAAIHNNTIYTSIVKCTKQIFGTFRSQDVEGKIILQPKGSEPNTPFQYITIKHQGLVSSVSAVGALAYLGLGSSANDGSL